MIGLIALAAAVAVPSLEPGEAALALARAMSDTPPGQAAVEEAAKEIASMLLGAQAAWRGAPCDPTLPACRAAADRIGHAFAPAVVAERQAQGDRLLAIIIEAEMQPAEIADATRFLSTKSGRAFAEVLQASARRAEWSPDLRSRFNEAVMNPPAATSTNGMIDRFYDETAGLPRRALPPVPPPVLPPPARKP